MDELKWGIYLFLSKFVNKYYRKLKYCIIFVILICFLFIEKFETIWRAFYFGWVLLHILQIRRLFLMVFKTDQPRGQYYLSNDKKCSCPGTREDVDKQVNKAPHRWNQSPCLMPKWKCQFLKGGKRPESDWLPVTIPFSKENYSKHRAF